RVCYYGMRVLLTLYLVKSLMKGDADAALIYGAYTGLVYAAPILGGKMADKYLGYRNAVLLGAVLMAIGEFLILGGTEQFLFLGMGALIIGNGYFKANISTIVGKLYEDDDPRRDSGFTIFYIGINIGALIATTLIAYVGETYGFKYGFGLAGIGMLLGLIIFWTGRKNYQAAEGLGITAEGAQKAFGPMNKATMVTIGSLLLIPLCYVLILNNSILNYVFLALFIFVTYQLISAGIKQDKVDKVKKWKDRMIALIIFILINIVFWACFEQAGTSLTLFADRNVDRSIFGWEMPASMTQFFNPFFIIVFGSIFSVMWVKLSKIGKNPNIPMKFAFGILQLGLGFLVTYIGYKMSSDNLVPLLTLVILYMLHTTGELFLSPIGLSMVTKLSPKSMAGTAMGAWFLSFAIANFLGGQIAALTSSGHGGGEKVDENVFSMNTTVEKAFEMKNDIASFQDWKPLAENLPQNLSYEKWHNIKDWVELREGINSDKTLTDWMAVRTIGDTLKSVDDWLIKEKWDNLGARYSKIIDTDKQAGENAGISYDDWLYFRGGIADISSDSSLKLTDALVKQKEQVQKSQLENYINIFTVIGLVLVGFSILVALFSNPLKKLMHGVE
ncbi:MAG: peptide MFS transporter, partial [Moheibacter sp.]